MNGRALEAKIGSKGMTVEAFCCRYGFSAAIFKRKQEGKAEFTQSEMERIAVALELTAEEAVSIFFAGEVSQTGNMTSLNRPGSGR